MDRWPYGTRRSGHREEAGEVKTIWQLLCIAFYVAWDLIRLPRQHWNDSQEAIDRMYRDMKERK